MAERALNLRTHPRIPDPQGIRGASYELSPNYLPPWSSAKNFALLLDLLQGTVVLQAIIGTTGMAEVLKVVKPMDMGLTESAIDAIQQWKFKPAIRNGKEVAVAVNIEINFNLPKKK
jgi:TonB family protein